MKLIIFLFSPMGRVRRFNFVYAWCAVSMIVSMISVFMVDASLLWFAPVILWPLTVKRLHDVNLSGIYSLIIYQIYGLWALYLAGLTSVEFMSYSVTMETLVQFMMWPSALCIFYLMIKKGQEGTNEYGLDPTWRLAPRVPLKEFLKWTNETEAK